MSATSGSTFRSRGRLLAGCVTAVFALLAVGASSALASGREHHTYVAIGDSLAFGYSQNVYNSKMSEGDPASAFEQGYVNDLAAKLKGHSTSTLVNLGCPGETTESLIGNGALYTALHATFGATGEAPCGYQEAWNAFKTPGVGGPLHVPYVGKSQAEAALEQIAVAALSGRLVSRVTINIGANDELHQVGACEAEVKAEFEAEGKSKYGGGPEEAAHHCLEAHVFSLIESIVKNTEAVGYAIRHGGEFGGVNYTGPITFVASYDPFGVVFKLGEDGFGTGKELLEGSVPLASAINGQEAGHFGQKFEPSEEKFGFEACTANMLPVFNTKNKTEPTKLKEWTNMANFTPFEYAPGKVINYHEPAVEFPESSGRKISPDGPDIHATPAGYAKMASIIKKDCGS